MSSAQTPSGPPLAGERAIASGEATMDSGPPPRITIKSALLTTEFWLVFVIAGGLLAAVLEGWLSPRFVVNNGETIAALILAIFNGQNVALGVIFGLLGKYITSRGKLKSNTVWANASMNSPLVRNDNLLVEPGRLTTVRDE